MADFLLRYVLLAFVAYVFYRFIHVDSRLRAIPTVGPSSLFLSWFRVNTLMTDFRIYLQEGYQKHHGSAFKVALLDRWSVFVGDSRMIEDMRRAPDDLLSARVNTEDGLSIKYTLGKELTYSQSHIDVVRGALTKQFGGKFLETREEVMAAFDDEIPVTKDWMQVGLKDTLLRIISRSSNRLFVGLPLCREPVYRDLNINLIFQLNDDFNIFSMCPEFLKPLVAPLVGVSRPTALRGVELLRPLVQSRLDDFHNGNESPNDLISWLIEEAPPEGRTVHDLAIRVLFINTAAIRTTAESFTFALYFLAAYPHYVAPLREEIEAVINEHGWTRTALGKMIKMDSFLKESQRMTGISAATMGRQAMSDFTFSNGTTVPAGTVLAVTSRDIHADETMYPNAREFQGFRYSDMRMLEGQALKHHFVTTGADYMGFGHGKHACPGRFFAARTLTLMLSHVLMVYDVKFADDRQVPPEPVTLGFTVSPDFTPKVLFRARV
ncbi:cytochrome P450 [Mycena floridula]|nr:cytochrome P450 [Mycena floridula]